MKKLINRSVTLAAALLIIVFSTHAFAQTPEPKLRDGLSAEGLGLIENLRAAGHFTKLLALLDKAGLTNTLSDSTKSFMLFAPDDDSFALLPAVRLADLMADPAKAREVILPYILDGKFTRKDLIPPVPRNRLRTLAGSSLQISDKSGAGALVIFDPSRRNVAGDGSEKSAPQWGGRKAARGSGVENGWPCCGRVVSADHVAANGIYHVVTFAGLNGGVWR